MFLLVRYDDCYVGAQRLTGARDASRLGGQLIFANTAMFGRAGRAFTNTITSHSGGWSNALDYALRWSRALLRMPLHFYQEHNREPQRAVAWVDGSWEMDAGTGALGAVLVTNSGGWSISFAQLPTGSD